MNTLYCQWFLLNIVGLHQFMLRLFDVTYDRRLVQCVYISIQCINLISRQVCTLVRVPSVFEIDCRLYVEDASELCSVTIDIFIGLSVSSLSLHILDELNLTRESQ